MKREMDCSEARERLSDFFDGEMSNEVQMAMADHLAECEVCAQELAEFHDLSQMTAALEHPLPPPGLWDSLEAQLAQADGVSAEDLAAAEPFRWTTGPFVPLVMALAASVVFAIGWIGYQSNLNMLNLAISADFDQYFNVLHQDPVAAQQLLLAKYEGQPVDAESAVHLVGYQPTIVNGMPEGYAHHSCNVIKLPNGNAVHCQYLRPDGSALAIFEHDGERPAWFGDRPATEAVHGDTKLKMVDLDKRVAGTWRQGDRHITVVGAHDANEIGQLAGWFGERTDVIDQ
ncbi:hypothetical protein C5Y97_29015 [Blastopirellula marina]|uniref:Putative zinc-finger domain-containing protein n=2 Tax=Blastopirellula marina TaxID=124 RepID=A0A2S8F3U9_9BACT|nr:hypothetical protein C5Y98_29000 [Blastopirellula marina]PTL41020.1 hypothetical protein C5Y97_29015 [Blastopirellula marina]